MLEKIIEFFRSLFAGLTGGSRKPKPQPVDQPEKPKPEAEAMKPDRQLSDRISENGSGPSTKIKGNGHPSSELEVHIYQSGSKKTKHRPQGSPLEGFAAQEVISSLFDRAPIGYIITDQSGLIGLMRHLHGLGFVFLSVKCELIK